MFFDIGSNIGMWTLQNLNKCEKIISIEASPFTFNKLINNCGNNKKIICLNYAVCNNNFEDITFYHADADTISSINKEWLTNKKSRFYNHSYREIICKTTTIDKLIEIYGLPDLIKIDVEGGEYECITSLTKKNKCLCFEWASELNDITFKCLDYLFNLGYTMFYVQYEDNYTFRPDETSYYDIKITKEIISKSVPKKDWGMLWCK